LISREEDVREQKEEKGGRMEVGREAAQYGMGYGWTDKKVEGRFVRGNG
jgi:hypothetical protein